MIANYETLFKTSSRVRIVATYLRGNTKVLTLKDIRTAGNFASKCQAYNAVKAMVDDGMMEKMIDYRGRAAHYRLLLHNESFKSLRDAILIIDRMYEEDARTTDNDNGTSPQ